MNGGNPSSKEWLEVDVERTRPRGRPKKRLWYQIKEDMVNKGMEKKRMITKEKWRDRSDWSGKWTSVNREASGEGFQTVG